MDTRRSLSERSNGRIQNTSESDSWKSVIGSLPRRKSLVSEVFKGDPDLPSFRQRVDYDAPLWFTLRRSFYWFRAVIAFFAGTLRDRVVPGYIDNNERRAERLYRIFATLGGSFLKIGQQLAIRIDILPYEYYTALAKLLDEVEPIELETAIRIIEKEMERPLQETFSHFDPVPVGSGSIATVYQAILRKENIKVAVKVLRPNIGVVFAADFDIIRFVYVILRFLNLLPKVITFEAIDEVHDILMEELDFVWEARHQDLYREFAEKTGTKRFSAPEVYFDYCTEDVVVQEYVTGVPLKDLLAIVEGRDKEALEILETYNITPEGAARNLLWTNYYTLWRSMFFHADPHPANIIVMPNNELVFVDFGAVGSLGYKLRSSLQQVYDMEADENIEGAARVALTLMEPLPPVNIDTLLEDVKWEFQRASVALRSRGVPWTERTSAQLWFGFFRVARKYNVALPPPVVRMIRGTMLYDTLAARIYPGINIRHEYSAFVKDAGIEARDRIKDGMRNRVKHGGLTPEDFLRIEQVLSESEQLVFQTRRLLHNVTYSVAPLVGQFTTVISSVFGLGFRLGLIWFGPVFVAFGLFFAAQVFSGGDTPKRLGELISTSWGAVQIYVFGEDAYWTLAVGLTFIIVMMSLRRIVFRAYQLDNDA